MVIELIELRRRIMGQFSTIYANIHGQMLVELSEFIGVIATAQNTIPLEGKSMTVEVPTFHGVASLRLTFMRDGFVDIVSTESGYLSVADIVNEMTGEDIHIIGAHGFAIAADSERGFGILVANEIAAFGNTARYSYTVTENEAGGLSYDITADESIIEINGNSVVIGRNT